METPLSSAVPLHINSPTMQPQVHMVTRSPLSGPAQMDVKTVARRVSDRTDPVAANRTRSFSGNLARYGPEESPPEPISPQPLSPHDETNQEMLPPQGHSPTGSSPKSHRRERSLSGDTYHAGTLYKTELCRSFTDTGFCRYGLKCRFAHGLNDLRPVARHKKYKTELCKNFARDGVCPYGPRCRFIHDGTDLELANKVRAALGGNSPPLHDIAAASSSSSPRVPSSLSRSQSAHVSGMTDGRNRARTHPQTSLPQSPSFALSATSPFTNSPFAAPFAAPFTAPFVQSVDPLDLSAKHRPPPLDENYRRPMSPLEMAESVAPPFRPSSASSEPESYAGRNIPPAAASAYPRRSTDGFVGRKKPDQFDPRAGPYPHPQSTQNVYSRDDFADSYVRASSRDRDRERSSVPASYRTLNANVEPPARPRRTMSLDNRTTDQTTIINRNTTPYTTLFSLSPVTIPADPPTDVTDSLSLTASVQSAESPPTETEKQTRIDGQRPPTNAAIAGSSHGADAESDLMGATVSASTSSFVLSREGSPDPDKSLSAQITAPAPVRTHSLNNNIREVTHTQLSPHAPGLRHNSREDVRRQRSPVFEDANNKMSSRNPAAQSRRRSGPRRDDEMFNDEEPEFSLSRSIHGGVFEAPFAASASESALVSENMLTHSLEKVHISTTSSRRSFDPTSPSSMSSPGSIRDSYSSVSSSISVQSSNASISSAASSPHSLTSQSPHAYSRDSRGSYSRSLKPNGAPVSPNLIPEALEAVKRPLVPPGFAPYPKDLDS